MTHIDLAKVWVHLQSRGNTTNILREILGELALRVDGKRPETVFELSLRFTAWIKVIFDMQRTYLQGTNLSAVPCGRLIPPSDLLTAIQKVVDIKQRADAP